VFQAATHRMLAGDIPDLFFFSGITSTFSSSADSDSSSSSLDSLGSLQFSYYQVFKEVKDSLFCVLRWTDHFGLEIDSCLHFCNLVSCFLAFFINGLTIHFLFDEAAVVFAPSVHVAVPNFFCI
jgi:hypothetical protein